MERQLLHMMVSIQTLMRRGQLTLRRWALDPRLHVLGETVLYTLAGVLLSAASIRHTPLPLTLGLLCAVEGWPAVMVGLGGCVGYLLFWSDAGLQGLLWMMLGLPIALLLGNRRITRQQKLLMPAIAGFIVSAGGVIFQYWMADTTPIPMYLLRVAAAAASARLFDVAKQRREPYAEWLVGAVAVLALAQVAPLPWASLGYIAAGIIAATGSFPAAALAGLALDVAQVTPIPMAAVLAMGQMVRLLPRLNKWSAAWASAVSCLAVMSLLQTWDISPLPGLVVGGIAGCLIPRRTPLPRRRGETGIAQVRLELTAGVFAQAEQLLMETKEESVDERSLIQRSAERACSSCQCRRNCRDQEKMQQLNPEVLHRALLTPEDLPLSCRKPGRILLELRRGQEQLRSLLATRDRLRESRWAVIQQYQFLSSYLQELSDQLTQKPENSAPVFQPQIVGLTAGKEEADGDRCVWFAGVGCKYYVLLCDGMGTGLGAAQDSRDAVNMLQRLLGAGFPAQYALRSLNSLCALRGRAGAVTVDLAELQLNTGRVTLYKWGAAPSYLVTGHLTEKIGTAGPPPGLSVTDTRETVERLSLRRGETLILVSDGVEGEVIQRHGWERMDLQPGEMAAKILRIGRGDGGDDATAVVIRLVPEVTAE